MPLRVIITDGTCADCAQALPLIDGMTAEYLLTDKGYDSDAIAEQAKAQGMNPVIPPRKNRKEQRLYDKALYKHRHLVENAFLHLSSVGAALRRVTRRTCCPSLPLYRLDVSPCGLPSRDDTI